LSFVDIHNHFCEQIPLIKFTFTRANFSIVDHGSYLWRHGLGTNKPLLDAVLLTFALQMATIYIPYLNPIFKTEPLSLAELALCLAAASVVWVVVEIEKAWRRTHCSSIKVSAVDTT
jgi:magnesium-transporting ATPase (P-type)